MSLPAKPLQYESTASLDEPAPDLGDIRAVAGARRGISWVIRTAVYVAVAVAVLAAVALYFSDRTLFNDVLLFLWEVKGALFILAISVGSASLISSKTDELEVKIVDLDVKIGRRTKELEKQIVTLDRQSSVAVNNLNIATGKLEEASKGLEETLSHLGGMEKKIKGLPTPQVPTGQTTSTPADDDDPDHWDNVSEAWRDIKSIVEDKVNGIENAKKFNRYARMSRHDYRQIVEALIADGILDERVVEPFEAMREIYYGYRPQVYIVPLEVWAKFQGNAKKFRHLAA